MNESATKAAHTAELLCQDLRELHRRFCRDNPTVGDKLAEAHVLSLLSQAVELRQSLKEIAP